MPRHSPHKDLQLCAQVREALYWALGAAAGADSLALLQVVEVVPMPDASRLLITLAAPGEMDLEDSLIRLKQATRAIRREVAAFINRRKVPELAFRVERSR